MADLPSNADDLTNLTSDSILTLLRQRYKSNKIYTWAGCTLVALNPYKELGGYYINCQESQQQLSTLSPGQPHVYNVAEKALCVIKQNCYDSSDASIIVSGESGSGKTESTKHLLRYLTVLKSRNSSRQTHASHIEDHILSVNPVLEAFGNAHTSANDNSSRFGKYIVLQYDASQSLVGAHLQAYMLEKTRVVHQDSGSFNFHVFYQFLHGISEAEEGKYLVPGTQLYQLASLSSVSDRHSKNWAGTLSALRGSGFTNNHIHSISTVLGAILCLGNVMFTQDQRDGEVDIEESSNVYMEKSSGLLGMEAGVLRKLLLFRCISASHSRRASIFYKSCSLAEAKSRRDSLSKLLYDRLFNWLIERINESIKCSEYCSFIGLLDIYGFETFTTNSLEQLCINYANERLQAHFQQFYLQHLQQDYLEENVPLIENVPLPSLNCTQLLSGRPSIFSLLDEECQLNRLEADDDIASKAVTAGLRDCQSFVCTRKDLMNKQFTIHHYAGPVPYSTVALVEKNKDLLPSDIIEGLKDSDEKFISDLMSGLKVSEKSRQHKKTVVSRFKNSLDELLAMLKMTECQYIRCIKPNKQGKADSFNNTYVGGQLSACGVIQTIQIRSQAHEVRYKYEDFLSKYGILSHKRQRTQLSEDKENELMLTPQSVRRRRRTLLPSALLNMATENGDVQNCQKENNASASKMAAMKEMCSNLLVNVIGPSIKDSIAYGRTKLFIKSSTTIKQLEEARNKKLHCHAFTIQSAWRRQQQRRRCVLMEKSSLVITNAVRRFAQYRKSENNKPTPPCVPLDPQVTGAKGKTITSTFTLRPLFWSSGIVSIRRNLNGKMAKRFHVRASTLLKNSHIAPASVDRCSLTDCLELTLHVMA